MLLKVTEVVHNNPVTVNPDFVVAVFTATEGEMVGKTVISLVNGSLVVAEDYLEVTGQLAGAL